jgi:hypothetical protein
MLGGMEGIMNPLPDNTGNEATFLFPNISIFAGATGRNMSDFAR